MAVNKKYLKTKLVLVFKSTLMMIVVIFSLVNLKSSPQSLLGMKNTAATLPSWQITQSYPMAVYTLSDVSCASLTFCEATGDNYAGNNVDLLTYNGSNWSTQTFPSGINELTNMSCISSTFCGAIGVSNLGSSSPLLYNGATWSTQNLPSGVSNAVYLSCGSSSFCEVSATYSSGMPAALMFNGSSWSTQTLPSGIVELSNISCIFSGFCVAMGALSSGVAVALTYNGSSWSTQALPSGVNPSNQLSCSSSTFCATYGTDSSGNLIALVYNGSGWSIQSLSSEILDINSISCSSLTFCVAVGDFLNGNKMNGLALIYNGSTWTIQAPSPSLFFPSTVSCTSSTFCQAGGPSDISLMYNGSTWTTQPLSAGFVNLNSVSCSSNSFCEAVGQDSLNTAVALMYKGSTWTTQTLPSGNGSLKAVSCTSSTFCEAVGQNQLGDQVVLAYNGSTWSNLALPTGIVELNSLSCTSSTFCEAVGYSVSGVTLEGVVVVYKGSTWTTQTLPSGNSNLEAVSCTSSTFCEAVGYSVSGPSEGVIVGYNGSTWSNQSLPTTSGYFTGVSCTSSTFCEAVGATFNGSTWSAQTLPPASNGVNSISCVSSTFCMAVGNSSGATFNGSTWSSDSMPTGVSHLNSVSCVSSTFCQAIGFTALDVVIATYSLTPSIMGLSPNSGPASGGTAVTISGANFSNADTVDFGNTSAVSVSHDSATQLTAVSPPGTGSVLVTVAYGSQISNGMLFGYNSLYVPVSPTRICDTRPVGLGVASNQCNNGATGETGPVAGNQTLNINVQGTFGSVTIPNNATAVALNITVTGTTQAGGFLTVFPSGAAQPNTSVINFGANDFTNFGANDTVANLTQVGIGQNGQVSIYNFVGSTNVIVDLEGYYAPTMSTTGMFVPISPVRVCDTRPVSGSTVANQCNQGANSTMSSNSILTVNVAGSGSGGTLDGVPSSATAVIANVTATNTTQAGGFLTIYPTPSSTTSPPTASNLNFGAGMSIANRVIVPVGTNGDINIYNFNGYTDVIVDINGYFTGSSVSTGVTFSPIVPTRICDTRSANGTAVVSNQCDNGSVSSGSLIQQGTKSVQVTGISSIPSNAVAVVLNVTVTNTNSNGGFLTIYPTPASPTSPPNCSDLNWSTGETIANQVVIKVGSLNSVNVFNSLGSADLIIDVMGYYTYAYA